MKRKFVLIKLDETEHWEKDTDAVLAKIGRIFGLYVADLSAVTHCCELTPSYELNFVSSQCECLNLFDETDCGSVDDYIMEGNKDTPPVIYVHCSTIDALPVIDPQRGQFYPPKGKTGAIIELGRFDDEDTIEDVIEYVNANGF